MKAGEQKKLISSALKALHSSGDVIEVRAIGEESMASGYFDSIEKLTEKVMMLDEDPRIQGIYITLNAINPALLARRANRVKTRLSRKDVTTSDGDIIRRCWLPIDIDPVRPSGVSSSEEEHTAALEKAAEIAEYLGSIGWHKPIYGDSGNGAHLLYRIDLPNDENSRDLVKSCLNSLSIRFSDEWSHVDTGNFNAGRIWKLYGTTSKKGDNTPERPHRVARILSVPDKIRSVDLGDLIRLSNLFPSQSPVPKPGKKDKGIDLSTWLEKNHLSFKEKPYLGGTLFILDRCPFSDAHHDGAYAIQFPNGAIFAGCHHDSCGGGTQRWSELRKRFEKPDSIELRIKKIESERARSRVEAEGRISQESPDQNLNEEAIRILQSGDPLAFMLETFAREHEGDELVAECLIMSLASRAVINCKGLHVSITGESGKGKSHTIDTMLSQVPDEYRLDGRMSDKALFYIKELRPGTVIALDDVSLSDQMQEILKGVTTSFQKPFRYRTVSKDRIGQTCTIPERCLWWVAKMEGVGDDQVFNRMLTCWIDDTNEQDRRVLDRTLQDAARVPISRPGVEKNTLCSREIWNSLKPVWVVIPYAEQIRFQSAENRRNPDMLLDLVKANAALRQYQRTRMDIDEMPCVIADKEDFIQASRLFSSLNGVNGGQETKLTKKEASLIEAIRDLSSEEITINQLQKATGWANSTINKLMNGYISRSQSYSGLLDKCPAISFHDRTITTGEDGRLTQRRMKVYTWDEEIYKGWATGITVWIAEDDEDSGDSDPGDGDDERAEGRGKGDEIDERAEGSAQNSASIPPQIIKEKDILRDISVQAEENAHPIEDLQACRGTSDHSYVISDSSPPPGFPPPKPPFPVTALISKNRGSALCRKTSLFPPGSLDPRDFQIIPGWPESEPCCICGQKRSQYQERMYKRSPDKKGLFLCKRCYLKVMQRFATTFMALPGMIVPSRMVRTDLKTGRCHLCHTGSIVWKDPVTGTGLCETCYHQEQIRSSGEVGE